MAKNKNKIYTTIDHQLQPLPHQETADSLPLEFLGNPERRQDASHRSIASRVDLYSSEQDMPRKTLIGFSHERQAGHRRFVREQSSDEIGDYRPLYRTERVPM